MKCVLSKLFFYMPKNREEKYTQISSVGAAVYRQVMKRKARNPCKTDSQTNQSAEGATDVGSVVPTGLGLSINHLSRGSVLRTPPPAQELSSLTGLMVVINFKNNVKKKTGNLGCFVCSLSVFFRSITNHFWQHYLFFLEKLFSWQN